MQITYKKSLIEQEETILSPSVEIKFTNKDNCYSVSFTMSGKIRIDKTSINHPSICNDYAYYFNKGFDRLLIEAIAPDSIIIC